MNSKDTEILQICNFGTNVGNLKAWLAKGWREYETKAQIIKINTQIFIVKNAKI